MQNDSFSRAVVFFTKQPDGSVRPLELATVREGFQALNRGLEGFCLNSPEWHLAFHHLSRAMLEPTPDRVEAAREALDLLASLTRVSAVDATKQRIAAQAERRSLH